MSWTLSASGHAHTPDGESSFEKVEKELHDELKAVLSKPKYGAMTSWFGGSHVTGHLHPTTSPAEHEGA